MPGHFRNDVCVLFDDIGLLPPIRLQIVQLFVLHQPPALPEHGGVAFLRRRNIHAAELNNERPVGQVFLFGGGAIKGFTFGMLVGIVFGTYSSVFVASALVVDLLKEDIVAGKVVAAPAPYTDA